MPTTDPLFRRARFEVLVATWFSYAGFYMTRKVFGIIKAPLKARLGVDDLGVSHLWTAFLVTYMIGQFVAAGMGRRFTSRQALLGGMSVSVVANLVMSGWVGVGPKAYYLMIATMAIHGLAQAMGWPHNVAMVANWTHREERGRVMALWGTCYQLGSIFAKAFAAFIFGWLGLAWSFSASSMVLMVVVGVFLFFGHNDPQSRGLSPLPEEEVPQPASQPAEQPPRSRDGTKVFGTIAAMGVIYFAFKFIRYALDSWSAMILQERFALKTSTAGYLSTAFDVVGFIGVVAAGFWSDRLRSRVKVIFSMTVGLSLATIAMWWIGLSSATAFVVFLGLVGFTAMGPDSLLSGAGAMDVGSRKRALAAAGIINGLGAIGP
ncbi:MAG TPA: MFS transporter, partial [Polyangiaceae bacterium]